MSTGASRGEEIGPGHSGGTEASPADRGAKPQSRMANSEDPSEGQAAGAEGRVSHRLICSKARWADFRVAA